MFAGVSNPRLVEFSKRTWKKDHSDGQSEIRKEHDIEGQETNYNAPVIPMKGYDIEREPKMRGILIKKYIVKLFSDTILLLTFAT